MSKALEELDSMDEQAQRELAEKLEAQDNAEVQPAKPAAKKTTRRASSGLDLSKDHGVIIGGKSKARYVQDGVYYDGAGKVVKDPGL